MEDVVIFFVHLVFVFYSHLVCMHGHLVPFLFIWYIFSPFWYTYCSNKNLATLISDWTLKVFLLQTRRSATASPTAAASPAAPSWTTPLGADFTKPCFGLKSYLSTTDNKKLHIFFHTMTMLITFCTTLQFMKTKKPHTPVSKAKKLIFFIQPLFQFVTFG
jgi:hypothetical protein